MLTAKSDQDAESVNPPYANYDYALRYAGLWAFSYATLVNPEFAAEGWLVGRGESETFYRTVTSIAVQCMRDGPVEAIWDIGCGVGRVVHEMAGSFPQATVVGLDNSAAMLAVAARILGGDHDFAFDLTDAGFPDARLRRSLVPRRDNVLLVQADVESLALRPDRRGADLVLLVNVLDRTPNPDRLLDIAMAAVRSGGSIVVAVSGSWLNADLWRRYPDALRFCLETLTAAGFEPTFMLENLILRELVNRRGATDDFPVSIIAARRSALT
ncbi:methyltransferase [Dactylosporangium cerinum]